MGYVMRVKDLRISFDGSQQKSLVVDGLDLDIEKGECLGIVGESGSGKTLSCLSLMGLLPRGAKVDVRHMRYKSHEREIELSALRNREFRKLRGREIAIVFQEPLSSLNPVMRCGPQILEMIRTHTSLSASAAQDRVMDLLEQVRLPDTRRIYRSYPHELSGGQLQRVMIAMAISCDPQVLIADEPTTALDSSVRKEILDLLKELQEDRDMTMIFISHDLGVVRYIADRVLVMKDGKLMESGSADEVFDFPKSAYTQRLLASRPEHMTKPPSPAIAEKPILTVTDVTVEYRQRSQKLLGRRKMVRALDSVSLQLREGEILGVIGESGSGKSTLIKRIVGLVSGSSGQVCFKQMDVNRTPPSERKGLRRKIQMIFQDPYSSLNPSMKIGEAIGEPMLVHRLEMDKKERKKKVIALLAEVGLKEDHYYRYPHEFSGGQRQRISIARALAFGPEILLCDESVSALDVTVQAQILEMLLDLRVRHNLSILFVSHDLPVVRYLSDRVLVMRDGRIVDRGTTEEVFTKSEVPYTLQLLEAVYGLK